MPVPCRLDELDGGGHAASPAPATSEQQQPEATVTAAAQALTQHTSEPERALTPHTHPAATAGSVLPTTEHDPTSSDTITGEDDSRPRSSEGGPGPSGAAPADNDPRSAHTYIPHHRRLGSSDSFLAQDHRFRPLTEAPPLSHRISDDGMSVSAESSAQSITSGRATPDRSSSFRRGHLLNVYGA